MGYAPVKVNPDPPHPGIYSCRWGLVLRARKKRQIPYHAGQEIAENAPPLGPGDVCNRSLCIISVEAEMAEE